MKLRPIGDRVVVKPLAQQEVTSFGIVLPDTAQEKKAEGEIVAVGNGEKVEKLKLKVGDKVIYGRYGGEEVKVEKDEYRILSHDDILAIIE